jgi:phosphoribosylformimino-5-aminoimidazole carboxamide ribonucleotide (ProFAR) isomerase
MIQLARKGVKVVSLTFNHKEGHLSGIPREQLRDIMFTVPGPISKVIIAGGITSL